jgi:hypothetical protein
MPTYETSTYDVLNTTSRRTLPLNLAHCATFSLYFLHYIVVLSDSPDQAGIYTPLFE